MALNILVVDDEPDLAEIFRMKFRREIRSGELAFAFAADGVEALEQLRQDPSIEVVMTDVRMPRMDGLTLLARLGELDRVIKAVVVTAYGDMPNIRTAMNRGAFDFLVKPIELDDLEITLYNALGAVEELKRERLVRETFGRYLSPELASMLLASPEVPGPGGVKRLVTILLSDLRGFSMFAEQRPPEQVVEVLNLYLAEMAEVIARRGGLIDEFIGDAILVLFGAPFQREDDAARAVACALEMQRAMTGLNARLAGMGLPPLRMGIGVHTGEVVVGNIGSVRRMKYGVVGSAVNLAGRIESFTVGGQILVSERTRREAGAAVRVGRESQLSAKGLKQPVTVLEVTGMGAPYDLWLPADEGTMVRLERTLPVRYTRLEGKLRSGESLEAEVVSLSTAGAVLRTPHPEEAFADLCVLMTAPKDGATVLGEAYAKVERSAGDTMTVRFTALAPEVEATLRQWDEGRGGRPDEAVAPSGEG